MLIALIGLIAITIFRSGHDNDSADSTSSETYSSQSPFEEVAQRVEEARHGVPTGVPLNPHEEDFLTVYEQVGLGIALMLAIGLSSRKFAPRLGTILMERFNPWAAIAGPSQVAEEQSVADFALQLQIVERGHAGIARSREEILAEFLQSAPNQLANLRTLFAEISRSTDPDARRKSLGDLGLEVTSLKNRVGNLELTPAWHLASSLEKLLGQLADKPANITPSSLRTTAAGLLLLNDLCVPGVRKDLAADPPARFLAVDDDPISRRAVSMCLKKIAQAPDIAEHGEAALELAERQTYDAIFLDVEMPGLDGFEVCTKIHKLETNRVTPVVFVTGHSDFESRSKSTSSGGRDLIAKPFLSAEITLKAITLLFRARLEREKAGRELLAKAAVESKASAPTKEATKDLVVAAKEAAVAPGDKESAKPAIARISKNDDSKLSQELTPTAQKDEKSESTGDKSPDSTLSDTKEFAMSFANHRAEHLREFQALVSALNVTDSSQQRHEILGKLYVGLNMLRSKAARAGLKAVCELASALGKLISKLLDKPTLFTPSALQAISAAIHLLEELAPGGVEPDLSNPPVRALVVDDEPLTRRAISNALQLTFGKPDNAENGQAAVALTQGKVFDVIFMDIMMPEMDGFETCSKIRDTKLNGSTPVIFVTSHKDTESRNKAFYSGGNGFISKPVLPAEIFLTALTFTLRARMGENKTAARAEILEEAVC